MVKALVLLHWNIANCSLMKLVHKCVDCCPVFMHLFYIYVCVYIYIYIYNITHTQI